MNEMRKPSCVTIYRAGLRWTLVGVDHVINAVQVFGVECCGTRGNYMSPIAGRSGRSLRATRKGWDSKEDAPRSVKMRRIFENIIFWMMQGVVRANSSVNYYWRKGCGIGPTPILQFGRPSRAEEYSTDVR